MTEQALDLKRSLQIVRRNWLVVLVAAAIGLVAGGAYAVLQPPMLASTALVRTVSTQGGSANGSNAAATLVVIASSDPVLRLAQPAIQPHLSTQALQKELRVTSLTSGIISIRARARTAAEAKATANAVARGFVTYIMSPVSLSGSTRALVLQPASIATGRSLVVSVALYGVLGIVAGVILGMIGVLAVRRRDRRLRQRDEIADSIGIPVLASLPVAHPSDPAGWVRLLTEYEPSAVDAWRLRGALDYLGAGKSGPAGASPSGLGQPAGISLAVLSLRSDPGAVALGPQLAAFTASLGIGTHLVIGPQQDPAVTATLRTACTGAVAAELKWSRHLQVTVRDDGEAGEKTDAALTILVAVVDEQAPEVPDLTRTAVAVLGVSAGAATADDLARVAVSAADRGHKLAGILVANPDSADHTTGRFPELARTTTRREPTRLTGIPTETRQWMTQTRRR
jgi:capsular polysaccharide biosynthesis protein